MQWKIVNASVSQQKNKPLGIKSKDDDFLIWKKGKIKLFEESDKLRSDILFEKCLESSIDEWIGLRENN